MFIKNIMVGYLCFQAVIERLPMHILPFYKKLHGRSNLLSNILDCSWSTVSYNHKRGSNIWPRVLYKSHDKVKWVCVHFQKCWVLLFSQELKMAFRNYTCAISFKWVLIYRILRSYQQYYKRLIPRLLWY